MGYKGLVFLVLLAWRNFEGALKHDKSAGSRGGGIKWCKHDLGCVVEKNLICYRFIVESVSPASTPLPIPKQLLNLQIQYHGRGREAGAPPPPPLWLGQCMPYCAPRLLLGVQRNNQVVVKFRTKSREVCSTVRTAVVYWLGHLRGTVSSWCVFIALKMFPDKKQV